MPEAPAPLNTSHFVKSLAHYFDRIQQRGSRDDCRPVLVVVEDRNLHRLLQSLFNVEAFRRLDVLQIDAAKRRLQQLADFNNFVRIVGVEFDIENINVGEPFEQNALPFHDGLARQSADIAQPKHSGPVAYHRDQISLAVYLKASCGFFWISRQGSATPGVYARLKSRCVRQGLVEETSIFPGRAPK